MRWFGHLAKKPPRPLPLTYFRYVQLTGSPGTLWEESLGDLISQLAWEQFSVPLGELEEVDGERNDWVLLWGSCPIDLGPR